MTEQFADDLPSGEGMPTREQAMLTRRYLQLHNRDAGIRSVRDELIANGFGCSFSSVQRMLKGTGTNQPVTPPVGNSKTRPAKLKRERKKDAKDAATKPEPPPLRANDLSGAEIAMLKEIIGDASSMKRNAEIALRENKVRMGLNIILMERMIASPNLLLLDMRGTAALIDSLTISSKLSGGAQFEVIEPGDKPHMNGHDMKDITPPKNEPAVASIEAFRNFRAGGKGT